ncbi:unnamed protein product [Toxocara canis]|uniref:MAM domain-containing protein n=1 Tax=Toxocara canis TaxID=6265 RepID=A0A183USP9_TOXCA|nr:unnamed protein product [Toxocara canis]
MEYVTRFSILDVRLLYCNNDSAACNVYCRSGECCQPGYGKDNFYTGVTMPTTILYQHGAPVAGNELPHTNFIADDDVVPPIFQNPPSLSIEQSRNILEETKLRSFKISKQSVCPMELLTLSDFYACATVRSFNDDGNAASGGKMSCNFELPSICRYILFRDMNNAEKTSFRFYSSPEESIQWKRGHFNTNGTRFIETFAIMMDRPARYLPSGEFIFVGELTAHSGYGHAILRADIFCQSGNGRLTFESGS